MAQLGEVFDASTVAPREEFAPLPVGDYIMQIVQSEVRPTKDGSGSYLWLEFDIIDGEFTGRKYWDRLNLWSQNAQAVDVAKRTLSAICHAVNIITVEDSEQLHFQPLKVKMKLGKDKQGNPQNNATYVSASGDAAPAPSPAAAPAPAASQAPRPAVPPPSRPAPPAAGAPKPWERKPATA